ncbi:hypothetical protein BOX15_Mlig031556g3 [Macrostomum lignano]|uniref:Uncharacterized protein n=1 Tax=Macrostomum lignano TaxID=282301 RepID=A0A267G2N8_9PLAT|nr:hypothetical protein BOX15_Mlig031556g3 [Macrostomum lignano]
MASSLLNGIGRVMPRLLGRAPSPTSSRLTASLPPSATSDASTWQPQQPQQQQQQKQPVPQAAPSTAGSAAEAAETEIYSSNRRSKRRASPAKRHRSLIAETQLPWHVADYDYSATAESAKPEQQLKDSRTEHSSRSASAGRPLLVMDPREVKSVLTQVVSSTMRDLLSRDQEARERTLLRQIRQTLGEFEASIAGLVNKLAEKEKDSRNDRRQSDRPQRARAPVNNSADVNKARLPAVSSVGAAPSTASPSRETGQSIKESCRCQFQQHQCCCSSDCGEVGVAGSADDRQKDCCESGGSEKIDEESASGRVALGDSESYGCSALPLLYRPVSKLGCPGCTTVGVDVGMGGKSGRGRLQKNFNHHSTGLTSSDDSSSCSSSDTSSNASLSSISSQGLQGALSGSADSVVELFGPLSNPELVLQKMPQF